MGLLPLQRLLHKVFVGLLIFVKQRERHAKVTKILVNTKSAVQHIVDVLEPLREKDEVIAPMSDDTLKEHLEFAERKLLLVSDAFEQLSEEHREMLIQTAQPAHTRQPEKKKTEAFFIGDRNKDEAESDDEFEEDMEEDVMDRAALKKQSIGIVDKGTKKRKPRRRRAKSDD